MAFRNGSLLSLPRVRSSSYGLSNLAFRGVLMWSSLPQSLKQCVSVAIIKAEIKSFKGPTCVSAIYVDYGIIPSIYSYNKYCNKYNKTLFALVRLDFISSLNYYLTFLNQLIKQSKHVRRLVDSAKRTYYKLVLSSKL